MTYASMGQHATEERLVCGEPIRTVVAALDWGGGKAVVEDLRVGADDEAVLTTPTTAGEAGIDAPFGWPVPKPATTWP